MNPTSDFGFDKYWKRYIELKMIFLCIIVIINLKKYEWVIKNNENIKNGIIDYMD